MTATVLAFATAVLAVLGVGLLLPDPGERRARSARRRGRPPRLLRAVGALGENAVRRAAPAELERRIVAAGRPAGVRARELMAAKLGAALAATPFGAGMAAVAPGRLGFLVAAASPLAGFFAPDAWLARRAAERARAARRQLPAMLDLLRVAVEAGAPLSRGLAEVAARSPEGPLTLEWRAVGREVALGVALGEALAGMAARLPLPEVRALVAALDRTRRHGVPLGATIAAQARDARTALRRHVQEEAARAGPKIQLAVALLLVPSVLLLVAAALAAALLDSGGVPV